MDNIVLRVQDGDALVDVLKVILATATCSAKLDISVSENCSLEIDGATVESDEAFITGLTDFENGRLRLLSDAQDIVLVAAQNQHFQIIDQPVLDNGRLELRHYLLEQAVSETTHRYGNITL